MIIRRIEEEAGVAGHPFVDKHVERRGAEVVRAARRDVVKLEAIERLPVRHRTERSIRMDVGVVEIIEHLRLAVQVEKRERNRTRARTQAEAGVKLRGG